MSRETPDASDAELSLRCYEMRREPVMRASRDTMNGQFWPASFEDVQAVVVMDHPMNAAWRQVGSYWEMVYGMVKHGIVHAEYFLESNAEGLLLFTKVEPFLPRIRAEMSPLAFRNAEYVATQTERGRTVMELFRKRFAARLGKK